MRLLWKLVILMSLINISAGDGGLSPPIFTQEPQDAIFPLDLSKSEIILNCAANGYPLPHYRWKQNGTDIDFTMSYHYRLDGGSLAISSPRTDQDIGTYQCLATNSLGTILSQKAKLQFAYIEDFETKTRSTVSVREGQGVVLLCGPPPHFGEGNGNPFQYSCLENPRDGGAWWAAIYGVAQSRTRLKRLSISINYRTVMSVK